MVGQKKLTVLRVDNSVAVTENSETFDISHVFLPTTVTKLLNLINSPVFWPILYYQ